MWGGQKGKTPHWTYKRQQHGARSPSGKSLQSGEHENRRNHRRSESAGFPLRISSAIETILRKKDSSAVYRDGRFREASLRRSDNLRHYRGRSKKIAVPGFRPRTCDRRIQSSRDHPTI